MEFAGLRAPHPAPFLLGTQKKWGKENVPRRLARAFLKEPGPTPVPQHPTGRIKQVRARDLQKSVLKTPQGGF